MGLIRKTLAVGTLGGVNGSSKKQRVAKEQLNELKAISRALNPPGPPRPWFKAASAREQEALKARANELARAHNANPTDESWAAYQAARQDAENRGVIFNC